MAPTLDELTALARDALGRLPGEGQATVWWERRLAVGEHGVSDLVQHTAELVLLEDGRVGAASTTDLTAAGLDRAAAAARAHAALDREPDDARALPTPAAASGHDGWDPALASADPSALARDLADTVGDLVAELRAGAARVAIVSTRGADAAEERSFAAAEVHAPGRPQAVATRLGDLDVGALVDAALAGFHEGAARPVEAGEPPVVLGPVAVAQVLEALKPELAGPEALTAVRRGDRIAAEAITLTDDAAATLPRTLDAEGVPRSRVGLIEAGVAAGAVADTASGTGTGHATRPGHAEPWPDHLVLAPGDADGLAALVAPLARGLLVPAFLPGERGWLLDGAQLVEDGEATWPVNGVVEADPLALLASTEALSATRQLVATDDDSALTIGATLAPALRARGGVTILG
jgi:predicted Zn-dependent protease